MTRPMFLYVPDVAAKLGRSESAIRSAVARQAAWLPPAVRVGRRVAWFALDFEAFYAAATAAAKAAPK
jgi:predicted DNA-binding transcriptional regulator AlpA